jgi:hypothetical protein
MQVRAIHIGSVLSGLYFRNVVHKMLKHGHPYEWSSVCKDSSATVQ